jgi:hypothetical protein
MLHRNFRWCTSIQLSATSSITLETNRAPTMRFRNLPCQDRAALSCTLPNTWTAPIRGWHSTLLCNFPIARGSSRARPRSSLRYVLIPGILARYLSSIPSYW